MPQIDNIGAADLETLRGQLAGEPAILGNDSVVDVTRVAIPGFDGAPDVSALLYRPIALINTVNALLNIHGGGFIAGAAQLDDALMRQLSIQLNCVVVAPDYRLAPECPFPAGLTDCYATLLWLKKEWAAGGKIAVRGASAGGGLALGLAQLVRDRADFKLDHLHLLYPMLDDRTVAHAWNGQYVWTSAANKFGWDAVLNNHDRARPPQYAVPAREKNLKGLPSTFLAIGSIDLFAQETLNLAGRLIDEGVAVELHMYPGAYHGFDVVAESAAAKSLWRDEIAALEQAFNASTNLTQREDG